LVTAQVEVDGEERDMVFLTNNQTWSAGSVADLYRSRWQIEVFFKQIKQTLQLADFLGHSANAVKWHLWMAQLVYVLLRFQAWRGRWGHSFLPPADLAAGRALAETRPARVGGPLWDSTLNHYPANPATHPQNPASPFSLSALFSLGEKRRAPSFPHTMRRL